MRTIHVPAGIQRREGMRFVAELPDGEGWKLSIEAGRVVARSPTTNDVVVICPNAGT